MTITELFALIEKQAEIEAKDESVQYRFATKCSYFSSKMFCALVHANLSDEQIDSIVSRMKLTKED